MMVGLSQLHDVLMWRMGNVAVLPLVHQETLDTIVSKPCGTAYGHQRHFTVVEIYHVFIYLHWTDYFEPAFR